MKFKMFLLVVAALMLASAAFAINDITFYPSNTNTVLRVSCDPNADPIPANCSPFSTDGGTVWVYRDAGTAGSAVPCTNLDWWQNTYVPGQAVIQVNGTTAGDTLVPTYTGTCATASARKFVLNHFYMNNCGTSEPLGMFLGEQAFTGCQRYDGTISNNFFCVVTYKDAQNNKVVWVSSPSVVPLHATPLPPPDVIEFSGWCCVYKAGVVPCNDPGPTYFQPQPRNQQIPPQSACVQLCALQNHTICVGPVPLPDRIPHVHVVAGCINPPYCDVTCNGAVGFVWNEAAAWNFTEIPVGSGHFYFCKDITWLPAGAVNGCVCITFDYIEAAGVNNVAITPMDNSVKLEWATASETNLDKWIVKRDNAAVYTVNAANTAGSHSYSYTDESAVNGRTYSYDLVVRYANGSEEVVRTLSATPSLDLAVVTEYALRQNYPNPFNPTTKISYDVLNTNPVTLKIYNAAGQEVTTLVNNESKTKGRYSVNFDATNLPSGLYFYNIKIGSEFSATKKMLLVK